MSGSLFILNTISKTVAGVKNKKIIGYKLFAAFYNFFSLFPRGKNKVFFVMTHDESMTGNCGTMYLKLKNIVHVKRLTRTDTALSANAFGLFKFFVVKSFEMSRARTIFLDNTFLPMAFCKIPSSTRVAMLWHGTGTVKRFGLDTDTGDLRMLETLAHKKITHLFVASDYTKKIYSGCFGMTVDKIYVTGSPRCDELFEAASEIREKKPHKFTVLYAPTFREKISDFDIKRDMMIFLRKLKEICPGVQVLFRLHPYVAKNFFKNNQIKIYENCVDVSPESNLNMILKRTDLLITDYSSIFYDYLILKRPIIFYAPDVQHYEEYERGFYENYASFVPGVIIQSPLELAEKTAECARGADIMNHEKVNLFFDTAFKYKDSDSANRILEVLKFK